MSRVPPGHVYLVGFMGSGKSAVGRSLARALAREFDDTDALVEEAEGRSIPRIFGESGEGRFRESEWRVLQAVARRSPRVIATGGGMFLAVAQRALIRSSGTSVWLDAPLAVVRKRVGEGGGRPLWDQSDPVALRAFYERRRAVYALADLRVDASRGSPEEIARRVLAGLEAGTH